MRMRYAPMWMCKNTHCANSPLLPFSPSPLLPHFPRRAGEELNTAHQTGAEHQSFDGAENKLTRLAETDGAEVRRQRLHANLRIGERPRHDFQTAAEQVATDHRQQDAC